jgi:ProP effector
MTEITAADATTTPPVAESATLTDHQPTGAAALPADAADTADAPGAPDTPETTDAQLAATPKTKSRPAKSDVMPVLEQLATLYPALFGAQFLPLKRGIFQDLQEAHPGVFEREALKAALSMHTRSTRYLSAVSTGQQRHDLNGKPVEAMAPEHVHHALLEVFKRRQGRGGEDLRPKLRQRMVKAFEASGLSAVDYADLVRTKDDAANALLDEALAEAVERGAKNEALQRAFNASGATVDAFADMYGLDPKAVSRLLTR